MPLPYILLLSLGAHAMTQTPQSSIDVAAYYFPGYHADPRIDARKGKGWTEWDLVKAATPRFQGHNQPRVPVWGYQDSPDPREARIAEGSDRRGRRFGAPVAKQYGAWRG